MLASVVALSLLQAAAQPAAQKVQETQSWQFESTQEGCLAHASYAGGTVLSVFALPDQNGIGFLLQNRAWTGLVDGQVYPLNVRFGDGSSWPLRAIGRTEIDQDGPGLFFAIEPGVQERGRDFMGEFAGASGMHVSAQGLSVGNLGLTGTREATVQLAQCLSRLMSGEGESPFGDSEGASRARRI